MSEAATQTSRALRGLAFAAAFFLAAGVAAQEAAPIFLDYSQEQLDAAYDQRRWAENVPETIARYATDSAAAREALGVETVAYGDGARERMDVLRPEGEGPFPIHLHLHGGAWRALSKDDAGFPAPAVVASGAIFVALDFDVIPDVRLPEMIDQARAAVAWLHRNGESLGGDSECIVVSGHSSGAHMAGVLLTTDWAALDLPRDVLKGGLLISGMYDLEPVMLSSRSSYVELSDEEVGELSAMRHLDRLSAPVIVAYGSEESPEFQRHSRDFAAALAERGLTQMLVRLPGVDHFEMPYAAMAADALPLRAIDLITQPRRRTP